MNIKNYIVRNLSAVDACIVGPKLQTMFYSLSFHRTDSQALVGSTLRTSTTPAWQRFCSAAVTPEASPASEALDKPTATENRRVRSLRTTRGRMYAVSTLISESDDLGKGKRFTKLHWEPGSFWHVVDARTVEREDPKEEETGHQTIVKRVSGVRFRDNSPQTGRVSRIPHAQRHEWVPLESS